MARKNKDRNLVFEKLKITSMADKGRGVSRAEDGIVVFVEEAAIGDVVDAKITRKKAEFAEGFIINFHEKSTDRTTPFCEHYEVCGGCVLQHITYQAQLKSKEETTYNAIRRIGKVEVQEFLPIIGAENTTFYRNKLEYAFSNKRWLTEEEIKNPDVSNFEDVLGFHRAGAFDKIVNINKCHLQADPSNDLRNSIRQLAIEQGISFFDLREKSGMMRHIMLRITTLGEILLIVSFFEDNQEQIKQFLDEVLLRFPQITSLHYCINPKLNDYFLDLDIITYHGKGYVEEKLRDVRFKIGPRSFFQTSTKQAEKLYDIVLDFADFKGTENVYDLYTGIGSIALYMAQKCKHVVGIEEVAAAIEDAKMNAALNNMDNTTFYAGDVKNILTDEFAQKHGKPDILITDPPRAGMHEKVVRMLNTLAAPKIIYVSCNPSTQARDLNILSEKYDVIKVQPVDMFPHTHHIENVALLKLREV